MDCDHILCNKCIRRITRGTREEYHNYPVEYVPLPPDKDHIEHIQICKEHHMERFHSYLEKTDLNEIEKIRHYKDGMEFVHSSEIKKHPGMDAIDNDDPVYSLIEVFVHFHHKDDVKEMRDAMKNMDK
jgi:hypothetical protein